MKGTHVKPTAAPSAVQTAPDAPQNAKRPAPVADTSMRNAASATVPAPVGKTNKSSYAKAAAGAGVAGAGGAPAVADAAKPARKTAPYRRTAAAAPPKRNIDEASKSSGCKSQGRVEALATVKQNAGYHGRYACSPEGGRLKRRPPAHIDTLPRPHKDKAFLQVSFACVWGSFTGTGSFVVVSGSFAEDD